MFINKARPQCLLTDQSRVTCHVMPYSIFQTAHVAPSPALLLGSEFHDPSTSAKDWRQLQLKFLEETNTDICYHASLKDPERRKYAEVTVAHDITKSVTIPPTALDRMLVHCRVIPSI